MTHESQKLEATQVSIKGRMDKQNVDTRTMVYYLAWERKEILIQYNMDNFEDIMLSKISQPQKKKYCSIPLI